MSGEHTTSSRPIPAGAVDTIWPQLPIPTDLGAALQRMAERAQAAEPRAMAAPARSPYGARFLWVSVTTVTRSPDEPRPAWYLCTVDAVESAPSGTGNGWVETATRVYACWGVRDAIRYTRTYAAEHGYARAYLGSDRAYVVLMAGPGAESEGQP